MRTYEAALLLCVACGPRTTPEPTDPEDPPLDTDVLGDTAVGEGGAVVCQFEHEETLAASDIVGAGLPDLEAAEVSAAISVEWPDGTTDTGTVTIDLDLARVKHTWSTSIEEYDWYPCEERWLVDYQVVMDVPNRASHDVWTGTWEGMALPFTFTASLAPNGLPDEVWGPGGRPALEQLWVNGESDASGKVSGVFKGRGAGSGQVPRDLATFTNDAVR